MNPIRSKLDAGILRAVRVAVGKYGFVRINHAEQVTKSVVLHRQLRCGRCRRLNSIFIELFETHLMKKKIN